MKLLLASLLLAQAAGCGHVQHVTNRQIAIGVGIAAIAAVIIYAASQSSCTDNTCDPQL